LTLKGPGLEWLAESLQKEFPELPVASHSRAAPADLSSFLAGQSGILVSTTAILRSPPLPELALVVIPLLEGFTSQSFRSHEELHSLLWQLTDLHPRRRPLLLLQTYDPAHPALAALVDGDPVSFLAQEAAQREKYHCPPAWRWVKLEYSHPRQGVLQAAMEQLGAWLAGRFDAQSYLGPAPAPVEKIKGLYIEHLILRGQSSQDIATLMAALPKLTRVRTRIDPDPWEFFGLEE
jgi:primosomal protein N' (replication factor Y)